MAFSRRYNQSLKIVFDNPDEMIATRYRAKSDDPLSSNPKRSDPLMPRSPHWGFFTRTIADPPHGPAGAKARGSVAIEAFRDAASSPVCGELATSNSTLIGLIATGFLTTRSPCRLG
jgi:hypothetical protein